MVGVKVKIIPKEKVDLTEFFDMAEIEVVEFADYHRFKGEVLSKKHFEAKNQLNLEVVR